MTDTLADIKTTEFPSFWGIVYGPHYLTITHRGERVVLRKHTPTADTIEHARKIIEKLGDHIRYGRFLSIQEGVFQLTGQVFVHLEPVSTGERFTTTFWEMV